MHDGTQQPDVCAYWKQPITQQHWPYKRLESGGKAHIACYVDNLEKEEKEVSQPNRKTH
jgi:hypothetical protein